MVRLSTPHSEVSLELEQVHFIYDTFCFNSVLFYVLFMKVSYCIYIQMYVIWYIHLFILNMFVVVGFFCFVVCLFFCLLVCLFLIDMAWDHFWGEGCGIKKWTFGPNPSTEPPFLTYFVVSVYLLSCLVSHYETKICIAHACKDNPYSVQANCRIRQSD